MLKNVIKSITLSLLLLGCSESDVTSDIMIEVPVDDYYTTLYGGEKVHYAITVTSINAPLSKIEVISVNTIEETLVLYENEDIGTRSYSFDYFYTAPNFSQEEVVSTIRIKAVDQSGYTGQLTLSVTILGGESDEPLEDIASVSLASAASSGYNGYSFIQSIWLNSSTADPSIVDFYDYPAEEGSETLSLEWRTMTGRRFARLNGFDYGTATLSSVMTGYDIAEKVTEKITNIAEGDIIFIGADDQTPLAVVKVSAIVDLDGTQSDKYIISMKRTYLAIPSDTEEQEEDSKEEDSKEEDSEE